MVTLNIKSNIDKSIGIFGAEYNDVDVDDDDGVMMKKHGKAYAVVFASSSAS